MKAAILLCLSLFTLGPHFSFAGISVRHNAIPNPEVYGLSLGDGQELYGRVRSVNSISIQRYLTPAYAVVEMVIDVINSPLQIRIYSTDLIDTAGVAGNTAEPIASEIPFANAPLKFGQQEFNNATAPVTDKAEAVLDTAPVVKDYPLTTHSKTIEYKLPSADDVIALFEAFNGLWLRKPESINEMESSDAETQATGRVNPLSRTLFVFSK
ncbi:MAG: hypothetical protein ACPGN3_09295 [Opitutales bacterium]